MAPRGLKTLLKKTQPAKLTGTGKFRGFVPVRADGSRGAKLRGLTKRLEARFWSDGTLPSLAKRADPRAGGHWSGPNGGQLRGKRVDAQLTRLINAGPAAWKAQHHVYRLTKMVLSGLAARGLEPVGSQRCAISERHRVGTAADIVAFSEASNRLVVVELKCGYDHGRTAAAERGGRPCKMKSPCSKALDSNLHRHLAQLALTREMFVRETKTLKKIGDLGIEQNVEGLLLYVNDEGVEFHPLSEWWQKKAGKILVSL